MSIKINMDKAKDIWRNQWRTARGPLLEQLDVDFMRAVESGDSAKQTAVADEKQALRDVTDTDLSGVATTNDIKQVWPDVLGKNPNFVEKTYVVIKNNIIENIIILDREKFTEWDQHIDGIIIPQDMLPLFPRTFTVGEGEDAETIELKIQPTIGDQYHDGNFVIDATHEPGYVPPGVEYVQPTNPEPGEEILNRG
jgi:hypothetical protein